MSEYDHIQYTGHALRQTFSRSISRDAIVSILETGEVIAEYPDDRPFPSRLLLGWAEHRPLHVVAAFDREHRECIIVTAYEPDLEAWERDYKTRKSQ